MPSFPWDPDGSAGDWIAARLGEFGTVAGNVPLGYECYVSIPNSADPADASDGTIDPVDDGARLEALLDVVLAPGETLHCALWNGYGFLYDHGTDPADSTSISVLIAVGEDPTPLRYSDGPSTVGPSAEAVLGLAPAAPRPAAGSTEAAGPGLDPQPDENVDDLRRRAYLELRSSLVERAAQVHLALPHRDYFLVSGDRSVARSFLYHGQSPTMFFPADRSWFVNSDLDSAYTTIGGPTALLAPFLTPAWGGSVVQPTDPITASWDTHP